MLGAKNKVMFDRPRGKIKRIMRHITLTLQQSLSIHSSAKYIQYIKCVVGERGAICKTQVSIFR
jgi:hypothetical protein